MSSIHPGCKRMALLAAAVGALLLGCGQKGSLSLPPEEEEAAVLAVQVWTPSSG